MPLSDDINDLIEHDNIRARRLLQAVVAEAPESIEGRFLLAQAYLRRMDLAEALPLYRWVVERDPKSVEALHAIGYCRFAAGDYEGALEAYRGAFAKVATAFSLGMSALTLHRLGRLGEAIATYDKLLTSAPPASRVVPAGLQGMVMALRDAGKTVAAERYAHELIQRFRREPVPLATPLIDRNNALDFHEWWRYEDKSYLAGALRRFAAIDKTPARFPESFVLPDERDALSAFVAREPGVILIAKPKNGSGGQGITVTTDLGTVIGGDEVVVQRYLDRPYLVDGRKGHARIYGLVMSARPLRAYLYREGIVRFAPEPFDASPDQLANNARHVTNTALHRFNPALVVSDDAQAESAGHIWSLSAFLKRMSAEGIDGDQVFAKIERLVVWFLRMIAAEGLFERQAQVAPPRAFTPKLFGLDVLIDEKGEPWLIEMQVKPAAAGAPLVMRINGELFATIFRMSMGQLTDDALPPERRAAIASDPGECVRREREIEEAQRGRFVPLNLG